MSARSQAVLGADRRTGASRLVPVPDLPDARIVPLDSAPSLRRRRERLLLDDPASRRRPRRRVEAAPVESSVAPLKVLLGALATIALGAAGAGAGLLVSPGTYSGPTRVHAVTAGESLWSIAQTVPTERPLDAVVTDIRALNDVEGMLQPGDLLEVPLR